jgi:hypothetical protein
MEDCWRMEMLYARHDRFPFTIATKHFHRH